MLMKCYPNSIITKLKVYAAAASEARMSGCSLPVMTNSGSGNQGMATSIPVIIYAKEKGLTEEELYRGLVFSNLITIHQKTGIGRLSAFCGAVSAGCASGAAITYLEGGTLEQINKTVTNTLANISGIVCDGAKASCAAKIATSVDAGMMAHYLAMEDKSYVANTGILKENIEKTITAVGRLGKEGMKRSVVVVATGDQPAICRLRAAYVCTAIAEYFRDQGKDVFMMVDNVTRFAKAQLEIGIANGEPPTASGYPASVYSMIPALMERTGTSDKGTITAFYAVLVDGDDMDDPIADCVRGVLDGHIVLSRKLASAYHYPAVDVLPSISRLQRRVTGPFTKKAYARIRGLMATYQNNALMINSGMYTKGDSTAIDEAIDKYDEIEEFLKQDEYEKCTMEDTLNKLGAVSGIEIPKEEYVEAPNLEKVEAPNLEKSVENDEI